MDIVYILNDRYWIPTVVSAKSALIRVVRPKTHIRFVLIVDGVTEEHRARMRRELTSNRSEVVFVEPDMTLFDGMPEWHGTRLIWTRCVLNDILPDITEWACVCDGDTLWLRSPEEVFDLTDRARSESIVLGSAISEEKGDYFCVGFMLIHFGRMKDFDTRAKCRRYLQANPNPAWPEQDTLNEVWKDRRELLPVEWGLPPVDGLKKVAANRLACVHFYGALPWPSSWRRRMMDVHVLWWHLAHDLMKLPQDDVRFRMNLSLRAIMRGTNFALPFVPGFLKGRLKKSVQGVTLPLKRMLKEMDGRYANS